LADARTDETAASPAGAPWVPVYMTVFARVAAHVSVHAWKPMPKSEMDAADMESGDHTAAMKSAATRIRVAPRK
jgi:hypothetical protein